MKKDLNDYRYNGSCRRAKVLLRLSYSTRLDGRRRIEEDEQFRYMIQASNQHSQQIYSVLIGHELDRNIAVYPNCVPGQ
jgi:hypothetical protein